MAGAMELNDQGIQSTIYADNRAITPELPTGGKGDLLFDPQTAGGLLAAVAAEEAEQLCTKLQAAGYPAALIGHLNATPGLRIQS